MREVALGLSALSPAGSGPDQPPEAEFVTRIIRLSLSVYKHATYKTATPGDAQVRKTGGAESSAFAPVRGAGDGQWRKKQ
jgi:hypothetical protein